MRVCLAVRESNPPGVRVASWSPPRAWRSLSPESDVFAESRRGTWIAPHLYVRAEPGAVDTSNILIVCHSRGALDLTLLKELLGYFVDGNRTRLTQADHAVQSNDREALREIAHAVRGSAALFGAGRLHTLATTIERDAVAGELDNLRAAVATLSNEFNAVLGSLRARHPDAWQVE